MRKIDVLAIATSVLISTICVADQLSYMHILPNAFALYAFGMGLLPVPLFLFFMAYLSRILRWLTSKI